MPCLSIKIICYLNSKLLKVKDGVFGSDPTKGHDCKAQKWTEVSVQRFVYKTNQDVRKSDTYRRPKTTYEDALKAIVSDSSKSIFFSGV